MKYSFVYIIKSMVTVFTVTMLFSCTNNIKDIQNIGVKASGPQAIIENTNGKYTDEGVLKSNLTTSKMLDYSNRAFPYYEFPEGINFYIYDEDNNRSNIIADYAIVYKNTDLIDLQGNVRLIRHTNDTLFTEQLFYDQSREWIFTNNYVRFVSNSGTNLGDGNGLDSDKDLKTPQVLEGSIIFDIEE